MSKEKMKLYQQQYYLDNKAKLREQHRVWSAKNKDKIEKYREQGKQKRTDYLLRQKFNLTLEQYEVLLAKQNGTCAICSVTHSHGRKLSVDHCHKTGKIRGLLCAQHNTALGSFKDDINDLYKAIEYLKAAA